MSELKSECCVNHPELEEAGRCGWCGKPICRDCIKQLGYYCGSACLSESRKAVDRDEQAELAKTRAIMDRAGLIFKWLAQVAVVGLVLLALWAVWHFWLSPVGKIQWEIVHQGGTLNNMAVLGGAQGMVYVQTADGILAIDIEQGEPVGKLASDNDAAISRYVFTDDGVIALAPRKLVCMDTKGKLTAKHDLVGWDNDVVLTPDGAYACYQTWLAAPPPARKFAADDDDDDADGKWVPPPPRRTALVGLDLTSGKQLWNKELSPAVRLLDFQIGEQVVVATFTRAGGHDGTVMLVAYDRGSGAEIWKRPLVAEFIPTIVVSHGGIVFPAGAKLVCIDERNQPRWEIDLENDPDVFADDDLLFCVTDGESVGYDLATGKQLFSTNVEFGEGDVYRIGDNLIVYGTIVAKKQLNLGEMPGVDQVPDVAEDFGLVNQVIDQSEQVLVCIDRRHGAAKWQLKNVRGDLFCDGERLLLLMDTSKTSLFSLLKSGGETVLRQYHPDSGKLLYEKVYKIGLGTPAMVGRHLIGLKYDQVEHAEKQRPSTAEAFAGKGPSPTDVKAITAFRLK